MRELDTMVLRAKKDQDILAEIVRQNEYHILQCASKITRRYITKSDDEWSVSLLAFTQAIGSYDLEKGSFIKFADLVIKRRLIDFIRSQGKYGFEVSVDPIVFDTEPEDEDTIDTSVRIAVANQVSKTNGNDLKLEISAINNVFEEYGFSFLDLTKVSPQAKKTKTACAQAVNYMLNNPLLVTELRNLKMLPIKIIENNTKIPRKILERHRKYIIAAIEILSGEYPYLAEYLRYIREENGQ